jgi:hypothetical protein
MLGWLILASCTDKTPPSDTETDTDTDADSDADTDTDTDTDTGPTWAEIPLDTGEPGFGLQLEEVLAEPGLDANCDGVTGPEDQLVELVNIGTVTVDLAGCTLERQGLAYHQFPQGTVLQPAQAVVLFAGGSPDFDESPAGTEPWCQTLGPDVLLGVSARPLELPACTSFRLELVGPVGHVLDVLEPSITPPCPAQSLVRSPELVPGSALVFHGSVSSWSASPGTRTDGQPF